MTSDDPDAPPPRDAISPLEVIGLTAMALVDVATSALRGLTSAIPTPAEPPDPESQGRP